MRALWVLTGALLLAASAVRAQDAGNVELRRKLKDSELVGKWIYDDIALGFTQAGKTGKPLLVVFR